MKFPKLFKKKEEPISEDINMESPLPDDLQRLRVKRPPLEEPIKPSGYPEPPGEEPPAPGGVPLRYQEPPYNGPVPELMPPGPPKLEGKREPEPRNEHKIDLILQKLDTIDARLKLLEERTKR